MRGWRTLLLSWPLAALVCARGELPETPYIEVLRRDYEEDVARKTAPSKRLFVESLRRLEEEAVTAADLTTAMVLRDKRLPVEAALARLDSDEQAEREARALVLTAESAERRGGVVLENGHLASWRAGKGEAVWSLRVDPGRYVVELTLSCGAVPSAVDHTLPGGTLTFLEDTALVDDKIDFEVLPFETWDAHRSIPIGEIAFKAANTGIRIRSDQVRGEGLMRLKDVRLIPVSSQRDEPKQDRATVPQLEAAFQSLLRRRTASLHEEYLRALKDLEQRAEAPELKQRLQAEIASVTEKLAPTRGAE